jgi:hypothetical protein
MSHAGSSGPPLSGRLLNLGCGKDPWGDVRVDMNRKGEANLIADLQHLPFVDNSFSSVRAWHVLEHCRNVRKATSEAKRVGGIVNARFPYKYDRIPWVLCFLSYLSPVWVYSGLAQIWIDISTKTIHPNHPLRHRWMIQPPAGAKLNGFPFPGVFLYGRKARFFRKWAINIPAEWECWF